MRKTFIFFVLSSLIIISGCSAKDEVNNDKPIAEKVSENKDSTDGNRSNEIKAPDFKLATLSGEEFNLSDFNGKVVMLNFWGTWCPPCRKEIPDLVNLQEKYGEDGLEIVGITLNSGSASEIKKICG